MTIKTTNSQSVTINTDELQIGMFVELDIPWLYHPFSKNKFCITSEDQIEKLKKLNLKKIRINPGKSKLPAVDKSNTKSAKKISASPPITIKQTAEKKRQQRIARKKIALQRTKKTYHKAINIVEDIFTDIDKNTDKCLEKSSNFVTIISKSIAQESESLAQFMYLTKKQEILRFHSLNVCIISMLIGKVVNIIDEEMKILGIGALFHDIGIRNIPMRIYLKPTALSTEEEKILQSHCKIGRQLVHKMNNFPIQASDIVYHHHERIDGSGYPDRLKEREINFLTQITAIADCYENLVNPANSKQGLLPHYTLSYMYQNMKHVFPQTLIEALIKGLGVYPPGSIVELNNGRIGLVISVNHNSTIKPTVLMFNRNVPKQEPEIIDLYEEHDVYIARALQTNELSPEVLDYLEPGRRAGYSFQSTTLENQKF